MIKKFFFFLSISLIVICSFYLFYLGDIIAFMINCLAMFILMFTFKFLFKYICLFISCVFLIDRKIVNILFACFLFVLLIVVLNDIGKYIHLNPEFFKFYVTNPYQPLRPTRTSCNEDILYQQTLRIYNDPIYRNGFFVQYNEINHLAAHWGASDNKFKLAMLELSKQDIDRAKILTDCTIRSICGLKQAGFELVNNTRHSGFNTDDLSHTNPLHCRQFTSLKPGILQKLDEQISIYSNLEQIRIRNSMHVSLINN